MTFRSETNDAVTLDAMGIFGLAVAMSAARSTGLLRFVLDAPRSVRECVDHLNLDARFVAHVLDLLVAATIIGKQADCYGVRQDAPEAARLTAFRYDVLETHFGQMEGALRGEPSRAWLDGGLAQREVEYRSISVELGHLYAQLAVHIADHIPFTPRRILDVGCGSGVWSLEIGRRAKNCHVIGIDFPAVLDGFHKRAADMGMKDSVSGLPGDFHSIELPDEPFDLIVLANVLRLEAPERAVNLMQRMTSALRKGGYLLVIDALTAGSSAKEISRAAYALMLALRTGAGRVHSPEEITTWMQNAGIGDIMAIDCGLSIGAVGALLGRRVAS